MHDYSILQKGKPLTEAAKALLLLHGRGGTAESIISLADEFCDDSYYIVAPQATNNTWYPYSFLAKEEMNEPWLSSAVDLVIKLVDDIAKHLPVNKIYLMGFSQGACLALEVSARHAQEYAGIVSFTGGLIGEKISNAKYSGNFNKTKVFIGNSDIDPHVPLIRSKESKTILEVMGAEVTLKVYPNMPHTIILQEVADVKSLFFENSKK